MVVEADLRNCAIVIRNYKINPDEMYSGNQPPANKVHSESTDILKGDTAITLQLGGWNALKRLFNCVEQYFKICEESSPVVMYMIVRYTRYLSKHYTTKAMFYTNTTTGMRATPLHLELTQHI